MIGGRKFRTQQARHRERVRLVLKIVVAVLIVSVLTAALYWGLAWDRLRIAEIHLNNDTAIDSEELLATVSNLLIGRHLIIVPNDTLLFTGIWKVRAGLLTNFPRIKNVTLKRAGIRNLTVTINERSPAALWCGDVVPQIAYADSQEQRTAAEEAWGTCYLMDENSFIYSRAPVFTGNLFMHYYGQLNAPTPVGQNFLSNTEFRRWQDLVENLSENALVPLAILFVDELDGELYLENGIRLLIPRTLETETLINRIYATVNEEVVDFTKEIEYIDLRFGTKAFVRYLDGAED